MHRSRRIIPGVLLAFLIVAIVTTLSGQQKSGVTYVSPTPTSAADGAEMFKQYCAVCHGVDGKGMGPAMPALKKMPADLTALTRGNKGKFPELKVFNVIKGDAELAAHGSRDMPMWGVVFRYMTPNGEAQAQLRIRNLTKYIESMQK
jgi:mono/diheme cytochrome c family protein